VRPRPLHTRLRPRPRLTCEAEAITYEAEAARLTCEAEAITHEAEAKCVVSLCGVCIKHEKCA